MNPKLCCLILIAYGGVSAVLADEGATIKGKVKWIAPRIPARKDIQINADPQCARIRGNKPLHSDTLIVNDNNTVANVFVYVKSGLPNGKTWPVPANPVILNQKGCHYEPHVFGIRAGQDLIIQSSDQTLHNVNCDPKYNEPFNRAMPKPDKLPAVQFENPEIMVPFKCNSHPWMSAYAGVMEHPFFAVSNKDGTFQISGLPPGEYTLATWHEDRRLPPLEMTVTVTQDQALEVEFEYPSRKKK